MRREESTGKEGVERREYRRRGEREGRRKRVGFKQKRVEGVGYREEIIGYRVEERGGVKGLEPYREKSL